MKKIATSVIVTLVVLLDGCEPAATFDKPQPENAKSLTSFSERLQGKYLSADQASIVTITDRLLVRQYDFDFKEHKDSMGKSYKLVGDTLIYLRDGTKEKVIVNGDTIIQRANWTDTLFKISADNVLKKFKGYYFLNNRYSDNSWEVKELSLKKGVLTVGSVSEKDDIQKLKEITETITDTTSTNFILSRRQFKIFMRQGGFGEQEMFIRITKNDK
jgi:hypothetical protein